MTDEKQQYDQLLAQVSTDIHRTLRENGYAQNACIAATYIACQVLRPLGYKVEPLPCMVQAWNAEWTKFVTTNKRQPESEEEITGTMWSVGLGVGFRGEREAAFGLHPGRAYNGHLVACVNKQWLLDPTITQAHRPLRGLFIEPAALRIHGSRHERRQFFRGEGPMIYTNEQTTLVYVAKPDDISYMRANDWYAPKNLATFEAFANEIRSNLESTIN